MAGEKLDLESTDYDVKKIGNYDRRMEKGKSDAIFFHVIGFIATVVATTIMFKYGNSNIEHLDFLYGMPYWYTVGVLIYLAMFVIGMLYLKCSKTFSFAAKETEEGENKE